MKKKRIKFCFSFGSVSSSFSIPCIEKKELAAMLSLVYFPLCLFRLDLIQCSMSFTLNNTDRGYYSLSIPDGFVNNIKLMKFKSIHISWISDIQTYDKVSLGVFIIWMKGSFYSFGFQRRLLITMTTYDDYLRLLHTFCWFLIIRESLFFFFVGNIRIDFFLKKETEEVWKKYLSTLFNTQFLIFTFFRRK